MPRGEHRDLTDTNWRAQYHQGRSHQTNDGQRIENYGKKLLLTNKDYKLTKEQSKSWIRYAVVKDFLVRMPWKGMEEKKQKQGTSNARLAFVLHVHQPDFKRMKALLAYAKDTNIWHKI